MIRFSALLTVAATAMLVAGVSSASLGLIYASIAVSILAAITLGAGVLLRRRELFGAGVQDGRPGAAPADREQAASGREVAWADRDQPARSRDRDRAAAAPADREQAASGREVAWADRDQPARGRDRDGAASPADREQAGTGRAAAAWGGRGQGPRGQDRDQEAASPRAEAFRLPSPDERAARGRSGAVRRGSPDERGTGDEFWDRVSGELADGGTQAPVRPAWPATAGPRAVGAGSAAPTGSAGTGDDEPEPAWLSSGSRQAGPAPWDRGEAPRSPGGPGEGQQGDESAAKGEEPPWDRMVPRYVDDLTRPRQRREPPGGGRDRGAEEPPAEGGAPAGATAGTGGQGAGSGWSAWSSPRFGRQPEGAGLEPRQRDGESESAESGGAESAEAEGETAREGAARDQAASGPPEGGAAGSDKAESSPAGSRGSVAAGGDTGGAGPAAGRRGADTAEDEPRGDEPAGDEPAGDAGTEETAADEIAAGSGAEDHAEPEASSHEIGQSEIGRSEIGEAGSTGADLGGDASHDSGNAAEAGRAGDASGAEGAARGAEANGAGGSSLDDEMTIVPGVARYHRRGCILIRFLSDGDLETMTRREAEASGSVPCKACQPDKADPPA